MSNRYVFLVASLIANPLGISMPLNKYTTYTTLLMRRQIGLNDKSIYYIQTLIHYVHTSVHSRVHTVYTYLFTIFRFIVLFDYQSKVFSHKKEKLIDTHIYKSVLSYIYICLYAQMYYLSGRITLCKHIYFCFSKFPICTYIHMCHKRRINLLCRIY